MCVVVCVDKERSEFNRVVYDVTYIIRTPIHSFITIEKSPPLLIDTGCVTNDKGRSLMNGEESFAYREDKAPSKPARKSRRGTPPPELDDADDALLGALKNLRLQLAKQRGVPAYVVFSDRSLIDMAQRRPRDAASFAEVHGVGDAKLRDFGEIFLQAIAEAA